MYRQCSVALQKQSIPVTYTDTFNHPGNESLEEIYLACKTNIYPHFSVWFKYDLGQKYHTPQVKPGWGLNS